MLAKEKDITEQLKLEDNDEMSQMDKHTVPAALPPMPFFQDRCTTAGVAPPACSFRHHWLSRSFFSRAIALVVLLLLLLLHRLRVPAQLFLI